MRGLEPGNYLIRVDDGRKPFIGANAGGNAPVVVDGHDRVFTVRKSGENYTLFLGARHIREDHGNVVARVTKEAVALWSIRAREDGLYSIEVPGNIGPASGWTLYDLHENAYVAVGNIGDHLLRGQLWRFTPVVE